MRGIALLSLGHDLSFHEVLVIVQVPVIRCHTEILPHIFGTEPLFPRHQRLIQLLAMAGSDDIGTGIAKELLHSLRQVTDGGSIRLLDKEIPRVGMMIIDLLLLSFF